MINIPQKPFYFIRHGQTDWNRGNLAMGSRDVPLNQHGLEQAHAAAQQLRAEPITRIVSSPLQRAAKTAEIIAASLGRTVTIIEGLREYGLNAVGQSENSTQFETRVLQGLQEALSWQSPVLIVAHADVYNAIQRLLGISPISLKNCAIVYHQPPEVVSDRWVIQQL